MSNIVSIKEAYKPILFNGLLALIMFVTLLFVFSKGKSPIIIDYLFTMTFIVFLAVPITFNLYQFIPKLLKRQHYITYIVAFLLTLVVTAWAFDYSFQIILDLIFPDYFFSSYLNNFNSYLLFGIILLATTLLKLSKDWFYFNASKNKELKQRNEQVETQLMALRAQMNPHFLFNSLNVIYAMALDKNKKITKAIVELSDVLRYVIYDADTKRVSLQKEVTLIENYIKFQNHRTPIGKRVQFKQSIKNPHFQIYPMLFLPLLENSFKYGLSLATIENPIDINLEQGRDALSFKIKNPISHINVNIEEKYSGVGLSNLKNNLNLIYGDRHTFKVDKSETHFTVFFKVQND
ncbi:histidine kinase [Winogradskyella maritima]|uniref:Sensor histidine kinase n=1 Tax=Winogradskyella maritima TaxID=1517766 RepID=A0ABV8ALU4_9FLAO|nr:histidine kinase [Winogradskyella maritima]